MSPTWRSVAPPPLPVIGPMGWVRAVLRGLALAVMMAAGLAVLVPLRAAERWLGRGHSLSARLPFLVSRATLALLGIRLAAKGRLDEHAGIVVANHATWLDIFTLNALGPVTFVSKDDVAGWPGIGLLARATGTLFIARDPRQARAQQAMVLARLAAGQRLVLFPEGTSTDGQRVLPFKPTLFAAAMAAGAQVQPVSIGYHPRAGRDPRFYGWWGDMSFGPHALVLLAEPGGGAVTVVLHPPQVARQFADRKALALACEGVVRLGKVDYVESGL